MSKRFKPLVHYIIASCEDPQRLGAVRLNKSCWFSDTLAYSLTGSPLTEESYVKRKHGPVPRSILGTIKELESEGKIHVREHEILPSRTMRLFVALEDADTSAFTADELKLVDFVLKQVCDHTAAGISELSHDSIWEAANDGEVIPFEATLVAQPAALKEAVSTWADEVVQRAEGNRRVAMG